MKILFISQYYYPEPFKVNDLAQALQKKGNEVTVITGYPNYPDGEIYEGFKNEIVETSVHEGVSIIRIPITPRGKKAVTLLKNYISFAKNANANLKKINEQFDCIYVYQLSPVFMLYPGYKVKKKLSIPMYCYCLDLWPESLKVIGMKESSMIFKLVKKVCNSLYQKCDKIFVTSPAFIDYLKNTNNVDEHKIAFIPQHGEKELLNIKPLTKSNAYLNITYTGNVGKAQDFDILVKAIALLEDNVKEKIKVHIIGSGSEIENVKNAVAKANLTNNFLFYGRLPKHDLTKYYEEADILFMSLSKNGEVTNTIPTKLQSYLAVGRPILASLAGYAKSIILDANCGYVADLEDYQSLSKGIESLMVADRVSLGENARSYFLKNYTLDIVTDKLLKEINLKSGKDVYYV